MRTVLPAHHGSELQHPPTPIAHPHRKLKWLVALRTGLVCGAIFLLLPLGSPWSAMSISSGGIMGRALTLEGTGATAISITIHFCLAIIYAGIIAATVKNVLSWRGILLGGGVGLTLYAINFGIVNFAFPQFAGMEGRVAFTHLVFGLFAAALYKGMSREPEILPSN
jgi:hypothetical protein